MKKLFSLVGIACLAALLASCSLGAPNQYTITCNFLDVPVDESEDATVDRHDQPESEPEQRLDPSTLQVSVTYETTDDEGITKTVTYAQTLGWETVTFSGVIDSSTTFEISVEGADDNTWTTSALVKPGSEIEVVLVDRLEPYSDELALWGSSKTSIDPDKRFTISGDLWSLTGGVSIGPDAPPFTGDADVSNAIATASALMYDEEGNRTRKDLGTVLTYGNQFQFEGDIEDPTVVYLTVSDGRDYFAYSDVVVEPGVEISVVPRGTSDVLIATAESGAHKKLVESWQQDDGYLAALDAYGEAYADYLAELDVAQAGEEEGQGDDTSTGDSDDAKSADTSEDSSVVASPDESQQDDSDDTTASEAKSTIVSVAEGCEHVSVDAPSDTGMAAAEMADMPDWWQHYDRMNEIRSNALQEVARTGSAFEALLAMEMGAFRLGGDENSGSDGLKVYDRLANEFDDEFVKNRITPARDRHSWYLEAQNNDGGLTVGQKAPEFTLANLEGTDVALYDVLGERDLVLVDFWASWCGPCIADFPELKRLYRAYNDDGFEIVGVSIDSAFEDWEGGSNEHELPWIDLGEMEGWEGDTATMYGVLGIPKGYLLDTKGCIIQKNIRPTKLKEVLVSRYGIAPELDEEPAESESTEEGLDTDGIEG